jgi:hypothetical protein
LQLELPPARLACGRLTRGRLAVTSALVALLCSLAPAQWNVVGAANAHLTLANGTWTYRYFSFDSASSCRNGVDGQDPLNVITYQFGVYFRIFDHIDNETHFYEWPVGSDQYSCITVDGSSYVTRDVWKQQIGHGNTIDQAHFRLWPAGHDHTGDQNRFSFLDAHHEDLCYPQGHCIDENWEKWEDHLTVIDDIWNYHTTYQDYYYRWPGTYHRGWWQNGYVTRLGGCHLSSCS